MTPNPIVEPTFGPAPDPSPEAIAETRARDVSASLYMAAVGSRGQERYTRLFSAFDASGGPRMGWHWPACLSALNWLVYRSLWLWAVGALVVPALGLLLVLGVARLMFGMAGSMLVPLALTLVVAWSVVCGLFADAVYYKICTRRILLAVESSSTIEEARVALAAQSERRARWPAFAMADLVLVLLIGASVAVMGGGRSPRETAAGPAEYSGPVAGKLGEASGGASAGAPAAVTASASGASSASATPAASSAPAVAASAPSLPSSSQVAKAEGGGVAGSPVAPGPGPTSGPAASPAPASVPASAAPPAASTKAPRKSKLSESAGSQAKKADKEAATNEPKNEPSTVAKAPKKGEAKEPDPAPKGTGQFAVQIGIFAHEGNASKALASARSAGLHAFADTVNGDQQRVRAGPFASQAEAERAARKIKDLDLPAVVVRIRKAGDAAASSTP